MATPSGGPDESLLKKIEAKQDLRPEDVEDPDILGAKQEVLGLAADPEVEGRLQRLRVSVQEYRKEKEAELEKPESARTKVALGEIEKAIDEVHVQPKVELEPPQAIGRMAALGNRVKEAFGKIMKGDFGDAIDVLAKGLPLFALRLLSKVPLIGDSLKPYLAQSEAEESARKALEPAELQRTNQDDALLQKLQDQYNAKPEEFRKSATFAVFLEQRARAAKSTRPNGPFTLLDLVNAQTEQEQRAGNEERSKKVEEGKKSAEEKEGKAKTDKMKKLSELAETNPAVKEAVYIYSMARALRSMGVNLGPLPIDPGAAEADLTGSADPNADAAERARVLAQEQQSGNIRMGVNVATTVLGAGLVSGSAFLGEWSPGAIVARQFEGNPAAFQQNYLNVAQAIKTWLGSEGAHRTLGVELDGGVLEENDGTNWFYDNNLIENFDPVASPVHAVEMLLAMQIKGADINGSGVNKTAMVQLPRFQKLLRAEVDKLLGEFAPVKEEKPAPVAAPAAPAPGSAPAEAPPAK